MHVLIWLRYALMRIATSVALLCLKHLNEPWQTSGNISVVVMHPRYGKSFLVSPSAKWLVWPWDLLLLAPDGQTLSGRRKKTTEFDAIHLPLLTERQEIGCVVHFHSKFASALSSVRAPLLPSHYLIVILGVTSTCMEIPCLAYARAGSPALKDIVQQGCWTYPVHAFLLANHGAVVVGNSLWNAVSRAFLLESLCERQVLARLNGEPVCLTPAELDDMAEYAKGYGKE
jgi:ribulose-5-phosphate 4-epimerase/fuculose-1-phosphate aldolase